MGKRIVIIGGGPGGYTAAFRLARSKHSVTIIDKRDKLGGVCLHEGCIPSKTLLHFAHLQDSLKEMDKVGIHIEKKRIDLDKLAEWKNKTITQLSQGLSFLAKEKKIKFITGEASFISPNKISVLNCRDQKGIDKVKTILEFDVCIIATGSIPIVPDEFANVKGLYTSKEALDISSKNIPEKILIIGGGYIGLELANCYASFGSKVDIVEMMPTLMASMPVDKDALEILEEEIKKRIRNLYLCTKVNKIHKKGQKYQVEFERDLGLSESSSMKEDVTFIDQYDAVLLAIGRKVELKNLQLERAGILLDNDKFVQVDTQMRTSQKHIFAIGDVVGQPMLAHKAFYEGQVAAENIDGQESFKEINTIPNVIFTNPELAYCGLSEAEAGVNYEIEVVKSDWNEIGRAVSIGAKGFTKLIIDKKTGQILGAVIIGQNASELISELVLAIESGLTAEDVSKTIHPHPTLSESIFESAQKYLNSQIA